MPAGVRWRHITDAEGGDESVWTGQNTSRAWLFKLALLCCDLHTQTSAIVSVHFEEC